MNKRKVYRDYRERTYDHELTLIKNTTSYDELGNPIKNEERTSVLCDVQSIGQREFYEASNHGLKPSKTFIIHSFEYNGANIVEFEGERYKIIRTYETDDGELELTCEKVIGNG